MATGKHELGDYTLEDDSNGDLIIKEPDGNQIFQFDDSTGDFILKDETGSNTLKYDESAGEWLYSFPVNMSSKDISNVGAFDSTSLSTEQVNNTRWIDNFSSVQAAIDDLPSNGGAIFGPFDNGGSGNAVVDVGSTITVNKPLVWYAVNGYSRLNSTITNGDPVIDVNTSKFVLDGLRIDGNKPDDGAAIFLDGKNQTISDVSISNCHIVTPGANGLDVHGSVFHSDFHLIRVFNAGSHGIFMTGESTESNAGNPIGNNFNTCRSGAADSDNFHFEFGCTDISLISCHAGSAGRDDYRLHDNLQGVYLVGCRSENPSTHGYYFDGLSSGQHVGIFGSRATDAGSNGLYWNNAPSTARLVVVGGAFKNNGTDVSITGSGGFACHHPFIGGSIDVFGADEPQIIHPDGDDVVSNVSNGNRVVINGRVASPESVDMGGSNGKITASKVPAELIPVEVEGDSNSSGASVTLTGVSGPTRTGQRIRLVHIGDDTITVQDVSNSGVSSEGFENQGGTDNTLDANDEMIEYVYDGTHWRESWQNVS